MITPEELSAFSKLIDCGPASIEGLEAYIDHNIKTAELQDDWPAAANLAGASRDQINELSTRYTLAGWAVVVRDQPYKYLEISRPQ